jgi:hypothetical protein
MRLVPFTALVVYLSLGTVTNAQSAQSAPSRPVATTSLSSTETAATSKKVWTNENLGDLPANPEPAVYAPAAPRTRKKSNPAANQSAQQANYVKGLSNYYHDRIGRLQAQIAKLDPQIAALHAAIEGKQIDEPRKYGWQSPASYPDELAQLQGKRDDLLDQISSLEDEARHKGVPPNVLQ